MYVQVRDEESLAFALELLGMCLQKTGQPDRALDTVEQGLALTRKLNTGDARPHYQPMRRSVWTTEQSL